MCSRLRLRISPGVTSMAAVLAAGMLLVSACRGQGEQQTQPASGAAAGSKPAAPVKQPAATGKPAPSPLSNPLVVAAAKTCAQCVDLAKKRKKSYDENFKALSAEPPKCPGNPLLRRCKAYRKYRKSLMQVNQRFQADNAAWKQCKKSWQERVTKALTPLLPPAEGRSKNELKYLLLSLADDHCRATPKAP